MGFHWGEKHTGRVRYSPGSKQVPFSAGLQLQIITKKAKTTALSHCQLQHLHPTFHTLYIQITMKAPWGT